MIYDYQCKQCKSEAEAVNRIAERNTHAPVCCGERMEIIIKQAPMGFVDRDISYICPVTNKEVTTRRKRNDIMARNNLIDANDVVPSYKERKKAREAHLNFKNDVPAELGATMDNVFKDEHNKVLAELGKTP